MPRKRGAGEGSISRRADGRWQARYTVKDEEGVSQRKYIYGKTRKAVADELTRILGDINKGNYVGTTTQTLADYLWHWLEESKRPNIRPTTYTSYRLILSHLVAHFPTVQLQKLTPAHIEGYKNAKLRKVSPRTVAYHMTILRSALDQAVRWGYVQRNVAAYIDKPKVPRYKSARLTPENAGRLVEAIKGSRFETALLIALGTGLRRGEICGLHWGDIDTTRGVLYVRSILLRLDGVLVLSEPKTEKGKRVVKIPRFVLTALIAHREAQRLERMKSQARGRWEDHDLVICSKWGKPLDPGNINRYLYKVLAEAKLPRMRVHDLRHSFASMMEAQGVSLKTLSTMLGHSTIAITADLYVQPYDTAMEDAANRMDVLLGSGIGVRSVSEPKTEDE